MKNQKYLYNLLDLQPGGSGRIDTVQSDGEESLRLRRMGLCAGRRITLLKGGDPLILSAMGSRIGLSRKLAGGLYLQA